jgi:hypothetical protein
MVKAKCPTVVFLMETKMRQVKMEKIICALRFNNLFVVDCIGKKWWSSLIMERGGGAGDSKFQSPSHSRYC